MDYGALLSRAWNIVWEHKFLILLGVLVALGSAGASGGGSAGSFFGDGGVRPPGQFEFEPPRGFEGLPVASIALVVVLLVIVIAIGLAVWIIATSARGGLIAGAGTLDAGGTSSFGRAWSAGWDRIWTLLGIGVVPGLPMILLGVLGLVSYATMLGISGPHGGGWIKAPIAALGGLACLLIPLTLVLSLLRTFANRACMLEEYRVFAAYRRGLELLLSNLGPALILFVIQVVISIGVGVLFFIPALCCLLWPLFLLVEGFMAAYFSTLWTLAWRRWSHTV